MSEMVRVDLEQRSDEWFRWRQDGITATDSVAILGKSSYKTPLQLWREKTGKALPPDLSKIPAIRYGVEHESEALAQFEESQGILCEASVCAERVINETPFKASFDALTDENEPVEIKCPQLATVEDVRLNGLDSEAVKQYSIQLQHQLLVANAPKGYLVFFTGGEEDEIVFEIEADKAIQDEIIDKGKHFYELMKTDTPPEGSEDDTYIPQGEAAINWRFHASGYIALQEKIEELKKTLSALETQRSLHEEALKEILPSEMDKCDFAGVQVTRIRTSGRVDYKKLAAHVLGREFTEDEESQFRGKDSIRWRISLQKDEMPKNCVDESVSEELKQEIPCWIF